MLETLTSEKNPLLKEVRKAVARGSLTDAGFAIAEGLHLYEDARAAQCEIQAVIVAESAQHKVADDERIIALSDKLFATLATTESTQGILTLVRPREWTLDQIFTANALAIVLDGIQDPGNAGAILRAAEAFGATGAVFLKGTVSPYNPKTIRGSAGSIFRLPVVLGDELPRVPVFAAMPHAGKTPSEVNFSDRAAIVIGSEGHGVSSNIAARAIGVRIPTVGVESLNAAVAAGVLLYEARRQRDSR